jgi:F-box associated protein
MFAMYEHIFAYLKGFLAQYKKRQHNDMQLTFLQLPVDVICLILQELPLHTKALLSQTCRSMRTLLQDDMMLVQSLSPHDCFNFISGVTDALSDYVTCGLCRKPHVVDTTDLPYPPFARKSYPCSRDWTQLRCHDYGIRYRLSYQHVQLVLKYSRRQLSHQPIQESYLSCLLRPFTAHALMFDRVTIEFTVQPRVIDGRFILHSQWKYKIRGRSVFMEDIRPSILCPHLNLTHTSNQFLRSNPLISTVSSAIDNPGEKIYGSCTRCATDYSILMLPSGVNVEAWQDLGNSGSPWDPYWIAQMNDSDNSEFWGPSVPHESQSIMESWKQSETGLLG